jgi:ankyrin repeat protein
LNSTIDSYTMDTPLGLAVKGSHIRATRLLLEKGANVNVMIKIGLHRMSPLYVAAMDGQLTIVKLLIAAGVDANGTDYLRLPIRPATEKGYTHIVKELINAGANVNIMNGKINELMDGAYLYPEIIELLRQHGATGKMRH